MYVIIFTLHDRGTVAVAVGIADIASSVGNHRRVWSRIIVIDGLIQWVSTIGASHLNINRLWLPSSIKFIPSNCVYENKTIKSIVIENMSKLEGIESEAFQNTNLKFIAIPNSVVFLSAKCFSECGSLSSVTFESKSKLSRIESEAFRKTDLQFITIPDSVVFFGRRMLLWVPITFLGYI
jgi:hypothetical protein